MKEINHEYYISPELAKLLKRAGFDWECRKIYIEDQHMWNLGENHIQASRIIKLDYCLLAPTLEVVQRWLREVKGKEVEIEVYPDELVGTTWGFYLYDLDACDSIVFQNPYTYNTYEEAQESGIKKALEIILEK